MVAIKVPYSATHSTCVCAFFTLPPCHDNESLVPPSDALAPVNLPEHVVGPAVPEVRVVRLRLQLDLDQVDRAGHHQLRHSAGATCPEDGVVGRS